MKPTVLPHQQAISRLVDAMASGSLGHQSPGNCALSHLIEGKRWMDIIDPVKGTINHKLKLSDPRNFADGLREITASGLSVDQVIKIEAEFAGRVKVSNGDLPATLDDDTDPGGIQGLSAVINMLESGTSLPPTSLVRKTRALA